MDKHGKLTDILVLDCYREDQKTGLKILQEKELTVWADEQHKEIIKKTHGVTNVYNHTTPCEFDVFLDPRYDREFVKKEIEANILCAG